MTYIRVKQLEVGQPIPNRRGHPGCPAGTKVWTIISPHGYFHTPYRDRAAAEKIAAVAAGWGQRILEWNFSWNPRFTTLW